jgi:hypothetical protein
VPGGDMKSLTPERFTVSVSGACGEWNLPEDNHNFTSANQSVTVNGASASLWTSDDDYHVRRVALAHFGGHQYVFDLEYDFGPDTPASGASAQLAIYMQVLQGFKYTGPAS